MIRSFQSTIFFILFCFTNLLAQVQEKIAIQFQPIFKNQPLVLTEEYNKDNSDTISIEVFKCYISNLKFFLDDQLVFRELNSYHLLNGEDPNSLSLILKTPEKINFNHLSFTVGIDSLTNAKGPMEGDLDPMHGMYWTWQSGYINFKLEGHSHQSSARNQQYQYHLGGFLNKNEAAMVVHFSIKDTTGLIIDIDLDGFLNKIDIAKKAEIMSPGKAAVKLSKILANQFSLR